MIPRKLILGLGLLGLMTWLQTPPVRADETAPPKEGKAEAKPRVEVVFCLDTTGSMSGLIDAAKKKIWTISNQIAAEKPLPQLKVGLVAYRDRGDSYITKVFDLSEDLDSVHATLMGFRADEGGDGPESVNQALFDSVHKISWSKDKKVLKMIFLVGDAPPHMDYADDVKYPETCKEALKRNIIINTVLCGGAGDAKEHWLKICRATEGFFLNIEADGGPVVAIATPFDKELAEINTKISDGTLVFGDATMRARGEKLAKEGALLETYDAPARAIFYARGGGGTSYDLLQNIKEGKVKLEALKPEELPKELTGKTLVEQKAILEKLDKERQALSRRALELEKLRDEFIAKKTAEDKKLAPVDAFDARVVETIRMIRRR